MPKRRGNDEKNESLHGVDTKIKGTDGNLKRRKVITRSVDMQWSSSQTKTSKQHKTVTLSDKTREKATTSKTS